MILNEQRGRMHIQVLIHEVNQRCVLEQGFYIKFDNSKTKNLVINFLDFQKLYKYYLLI